MRTLVALLLPVATAATGVVFVLGDRNADDQFLLSQSRTERMAAADVERVVKTAPEPDVGRAFEGTKATCRPLGKGELRNPWSCRLRYPNGTRLRYRVTVAADGSYAGERQDIPGEITGCCIETGLRDLDG